MEVKPHLDQPPFMILEQTGEYSRIKSNESINETDENK